MNKIYSDAELLSHIVELENELGRVPSIRDMNKAEQCPSGALYRYRFGSWNNAIRKVGLVAREHKYTDEGLIEALRKLDKRLMHTPRRIDIDEAEDCPVLGTYEDHFGSYESALLKAGLKPSSPYIKITDEELIEKLTDLSRVLGHVPTTREMAEGRDCPNPSTYQERFGSWKEALKRAGLDRSSKLISDDTLVLYLRKLAEDLGRTPTYWEMAELENYPHPRTYYDRFGSWEAAIKKAGLPPVKRGYSEEELLKHMAELTDKLGHPPTYKEMWKAEGYPSPATYANHFGSWRKSKSAFQKSIELPKRQLTILDDCRKHGLDYMAIRDIVFRLVDRGSVDEIEVQLSQDEGLKYMEFVMNNFEALCKRAGLATPYKNIKLERDSRTDVYNLKAT